MQVNGNVSKTSHTVESHIGTFICGHIILEPKDLIVCFEVSMGVSPG